MVINNCNQTWIVSELGLVSGILFTSRKGTLCNTLYQGVVHATYRTSYRRFIYIKSKDMERGNVCEMQSADQFSSVP